MSSRPFHFTVDPLAVPATWSKGVFDASTIWAQSGTLLNGSSSATEATLIRNTDVAVNADVQSRMKRNSDAEFGIITNHIDNSNYYLWLAQTSASRFALFEKVGGSFTLLGTHVVSPADLTFFNLRLTTVDSGANKTLNAFLDGSLVVGPIVTANQHGSGQAGIRIFPFGGPPGTVDIDWWTFNTVLGLTSVTPNVGNPAGGDNVSLSGADFGDGALVFFDGIPATNVVITPTSTITCDTPAHAPGAVDVVVKFGTPGSEEFTVTLPNGFTYGGQQKLINLSKTLGRRLISSHRS